MLANFPNCQAIGCTSLTVTNAQFAATFIPIVPIKGQIGILLYAGTTGLEVAGAGISYGPQSYTLIGGVTQTLTFMNSNGSSLNLAANGNGMPIFNALFEPLAFAGAPYIWLTAGTTALNCRISYIFNDGFLNQ